MIADLIRKNRSCRRFYENQTVLVDMLEEFVNLARLSPSAANLQPLKYIVSNTPKHNLRIFECLTWAAYLKDWSGPPEGERPAAYIVIIGDTRISENFEYDCGIAAQSMLLGIREMGLAGCMLAAINHKKLKDILKIQDYFKIVLVIALGKPKEKIVLEALDEKASIRYWRDGTGVHHVPKRDLEDVLVTCI